LTQFLMTLRDGFEPTRASILNRQPLSSLEIALSKLISEETRHLSITSQQSPFIIAVTSSTPPQRSDNSKRSRCTHCHRIEHTVKTCYDIVGRPLGKSPGIKSTVATTIAPSGYESSSQIHQFSTSDLDALLHQVMSRTGSSAMFVTSGNAWLIDSAYCNHMTSDPKLFTGKHVVHNGPTIYTANGSNMHVTYTGIVQTQSFSIPDTYLVPHLSLNLLSIGQLCDNGYDLLFSCHVVLFRIRRRVTELGQVIRLVGCLSSLLCKLSLVSLLPPILLHLCIFGTPG
ncbi:hypothetical protein CFOL_v3_20598, partial [Cephalotus follicularis]